MATAPRPTAPPPSRAPGDHRRARARGRQLLVVLALGDVLVDGRADDLPARVRLRLRPLVSKVGGYDYVEFVGTGTVATAVLFSSAFAAMFGTFVKYQFQRTYDAILAAPVDTEELVTAEALWIATRAGVYGCVPMVVAMFFGLDPAWGMLTVPLIAWLAGFGWACFGIAVAGYAKSIENFSYIVSAVLTPLFLVAGTFFPLDKLPEWAQILANLNPLHHCVELVRHAAFGCEGWDGPRARRRARRVRPRRCGGSRSAR